ncbi:MAG: alpha/beta hydrolase [Thermoleophilaceae bacterium]|nr:alpha/beta hydrolase [Thermoleophilaceae bacterium]
MAEIREGELRARGVRAPFIEAGPADARDAAFFVHGNPGSREDWTRLVRSVGDVGRAVAVDMPGFGRADKPRDFDYTVGGYAAFIEEARRELGIERMHIVGHDFGGPFALMWALQHQDAFASAVLINTGVLIGYRWHRMARLWRTPVVGEIVQMLVTERGWRRTMRSLNPQPLPPEDVARMYRDYDRDTRRAVLKLYRATGEVGALGDALSAAFRALDRPALVVWGRQDPFIGVEQAELQRRSFPSARVVVLDDSGHWPFLDDPERVAAEIVPFMREQLGTAAPAG